MPNKIKLICCCFIYRDNHDNHCTKVSPSVHLLSENESAFSFILSPAFVAVSIVHFNHLMENKNTSG